MDIRPATDRDVARAPDWLAGMDLRPDRWRDQRTRAVIGFDVESNKPLAVGRIFTSRVHDDRYFLSEFVTWPSATRTLKT